MLETLDIDYLRTWVGRKQTREDVATASKSAGLRATLDYDSDPWAGQLFPLAHWLHFTPETPQHGLAADGHPRKGGFLPPVPLPRRMWAGSEVNLHQPAKVGDLLRQVSSISDVALKEGKSGQLVFLTVVHEVHIGERLELATIDTQTIVYREAATVSEAPEPSSADGVALESIDTSAWDYARVVEPDETMLFRYSALTFNAHRIHYDRNYCINEEGYPGLVVHGPLLATLMVDAFMRHNPGTILRGFKFSAHMPVFDQAPVAFVGRRTDENTTEVATLNSGGAVCLKGAIVH